MSDSAATQTSASAALQRLEQTLHSGAIGHLPNWPSVRADDVEAGVRLLVGEVETAFGELEASLKPSWPGLMEPLQQLEHRLGKVIAPIMHLISVKYSDALQESYDRVRSEVVALGNRMSQSRAVYDGLTALKEGAEGRELSATRQRIVSESLRGMERSGVHLTGTQRERYQSINERLAQLSTDFQTNLVKAEKAARVRVSDAQRLTGIPQGVIDSAYQQAVTDAASADKGDDVDRSATDGPWAFGVNAVNYMAIIQYAQDRSLREEFYRAFRRRGCDAQYDNQPIVVEILQLRQEQAQLVGFDNYADLSIDAKMAPSVTSVWELLDKLEQAARPAAQRELEELTKFAGTGLEDSALAPWDVAFYSERLSEDRFGYDAEALRDYFQLPLVLKGLFELVTSLYGVEIVESRDPDVPVWDDAVQFFEVLRDGVVIAGFYVDPYARPGEKRGGAWMNTVVGRDRLLAIGDADASLPVALFVMNARPPAAGKPGLMSLDEVRTLFHEFGHATQHMFTEVDEGGASGMNLVEWDSVELASQFNEYWMEHKPFLRNLSAHVDTGQPIDDKTLDSILASQNFMVGNATLRQILFAKLDMRLHEEFGVSADDASPFEIERVMARAIVVTPMLADESQLPAFGHLFAGGYAAGYYSYKWAEVLAADAFAAFREVGLDNTPAVQEVSARFKATVLGLGGSLPAAEVYRLFRGRDATPEALLADQGLLQAS